MGTLVLLLLGDGVNAGVTLRKSYAANAGWPSRYSAEIIRRC